MRRKLFHIGITAALLLGGWGGTLAAVVCRHAGVRVEAARGAAASAMPECCRTEAVGEGAHCPMPPEPSDAAPQHPNGGDRHHGETHDSQGTAEESGAARAADPESAGLRARAAAAHPADPCAHCVGRSELPSSSLREPASRAAKRADADADAVHAQSPPAPRHASFARRVAPSQQAPPGAPARRHLLLKVFLI